MYTETSGEAAVGQVVTNEQAGNGNYGATFQGQRDSNGQSRSVRGLVVALESFSMRPPVPVSFGSSKPTRVGANIPGNRRLSSRNSRRLRGRALRVPITLGS